MLRQLCESSYDLQRVELKLGQARKNLVGLYRFRQLIPEGEMAAALSASEHGKGRWRMVAHCDNSKSIGCHS